MMLLPPMNLRAERCVICRQVHDIVSNSDVICVDGLSGGVPKSWNTHVIVTHVTFES